MILQIEDVTKTYSRGNRVFDVIKNVWLDVKEQNLLVLSGKSGSGKSTLLALMGGYLTPDEGSVIYNEKNYQTISENELLRLHSDKIGYLPQSNVLLSDYTILENVLLPFLLFENERKKEEALEIMERLDIKELANRRPFELSGGELRRASIARLLLRQPQLYLLDEPSGGLDKETTQIVMECLKERVEKGATVVVATHDEQVLNYGTRVYEMLKLS
ncbi:MAG: ATP-binding cassette domain-containing protein [Lachnospiraceae bacterium]|nr:ATP-binding cassette domain-containing protein [Lachnospiraceae bacterium]